MVDAAWIARERQARGRFLPARRRATAFAIADVRAAIAAQGASWFFWVPVTFGAGSAFYFSLKHEPNGIATLLLAALAVCCATLSWRGRGLPLAFVAAGLLFGFVGAKARTEWLDTRTLAAPTGATMVAGRVIDVMPVSQKLSRITLEITAIDGIAPDAWPSRADIRIANGKGGPPPRGARVTVKALLEPLPRPIQPGGYDYARTQWFRGIGARGRTLSPVTVADGAAPTIAERIDDMRAAIGARIRAELPGQNGAIAEALIVGERGRIPDSVTQALQVSGLAHILSISGLHMSLVAGGVFFVVRALLALFAPLVLRFPIKAWSAIAALLAGTVYLAFSGGGPATWRSYVMIAVMFAAVIAGRPALALHNLALAALFVLIASPESVFDAGFQMSFMAVMGLIAFNDAVSTWRRGPAGHEERRPPAIPWRILFALAGIVATSLVASVFSGLPAAYHFNRLSFYGVAANLLAIPVTSFLVMPAAVVSMVAMPFGLEALPLKAMGLGLDVVTAIAATVAALPGAGSAIPTLSGTAVLLAGAGLVVLSLWRGPWRLAGLAMVVAAAPVAFVAVADRPDILVEDQGKTVAVRGADGLLVPVDGKRGRFAVEHWLLADGDATPAKDAAGRRGWTCDAARCVAQVKGLTVAYVPRKARISAATCKDADIVISAEPLFGLCEDAKRVIDRFDLWRAGAHALVIGDAGEIAVRTAAGERGERPWVTTIVPRRAIAAPSETAGR